MINRNTINSLLAMGADDALAIAAPGRPDLNFTGLRSQVQQTQQQLNQLGLGRNDRVAIVLPNGAEMASAFIAVSAAATAAPLNPAYRAEEFKFYLADLGARALIVAEDSDSVAIEVATSLGMRVIPLRVQAGDAAGVFTLLPDQQHDHPPPQQGGEADATDMALVLHTSGTTSRPKIVPLSQANICASANNVRCSLALTSQDRGLNIMPLFHIHGLIAAVLAPLAAGGSVTCTPGFNAMKFFPWMQASCPTWYTAVPTMHQTILARAKRNQDIIDANPLRFVRSSSSAIPPQVIVELEQVFRTPVIEAYGMTEAAHQMSCNPLPPAIRKVGSVGLAAGPEIAIMDHEGSLLPTDSIGEVVIRGSNVSAGYENNPTANAEAYCHGWFRTGDQGRLDAQGYLTLTGRLKEIINRGGEKISPREVDEVLMDHPAVQQVVTFALPHPKLGEEVAAAIVLREGCSASEVELREFATQHLADFKIPRKILFLEEIPKGATGKLQRIGLAEKLGLVSETSA